MGKQTFSLLETTSASGGGGVPCAIHTAPVKPETKFLSMALRSIDKALNSTRDAVVKGPLDEARTTVASCLALCGIKPRAARRMLASRPRAQRIASAQQLDADAVLTYMRNNAGQKGEQIAAEFETDTATLRPSLKLFIQDGSIRTKGERRGTRCFAAEVASARSK